MKDINDILAKHFSGETDPEEVRLVAEWKLKNEAEYAALSDAWKEADTDLLGNLEFKTFDHKSAWDKVDSKLINHKDVKVIKLKFYRNVAAACAILLVGLTGFWFLNKGSGFESVSNMANAPQEISLPDGSTVWLAANSTLDYKLDFVTDRSLKLDGEAFFEVARDEEHPFIIATEMGDVEVLGTAFNVDASSESTIVSVDHGKVALRNQSQEIKLTKGQSANSTEVGISQIEEVKINYDSWKTGVFNFSDTPLDEVVSLLNKHYDTKVELMESAKVDAAFNGSFDNAPIDVIIESIVLTCDVEADTGDDMIRLR